MPEDTFDNSIPWKTIAASPDMMDVTFNNRRFPYAWRSSLAISVYEPPTSDLPPNQCGQRIAFVKVTCSLTGYQTTGSETDTITFGNEPLEELERLTTEYLGCYGALLNVAVFPSGGPLRVVGEIPDLSVYPHILDFTPKTRELIRSITESGELLTGSTRNIGIDQSLTTTTKNETSVGAEVEVGYEAGGAKATATGKISHTWGTTEEDKKGLKVDSGDSQTSKQAHSTSMDQLYSLLTGYHSGTNRATFIMLARPGTLQATNRRTFAQGLRMLEGVQDFILVVARPEEQGDLCIEASLKTGHFPEAVELVGEEEAWDHDIQQFIVTVHARGGDFLEGNGEEVIFGSPERPQDTLTLDDGWTIDYDASPYGRVNPGSNPAFRADRGLSRISFGPGISIDRNDSEMRPREADNIIANVFELHVERGGDNRTVRATGKVIARGGQAGRDRGASIFVDVTFNIHVRRPKTSPVVPTADQAQMLVTGRGLSVCYRTVDGCPQVVDPPEPLDLSDPAYNADYDPNIPNVSASVADIQLPLSGSTTRDGTYSVIRSGLISSAAADARGVKKRAFVDTDYFSQKVARSIPTNIAKVPVIEIADIHVCGASEKLLGTTTIQQLLSANLRRYVNGLGLNEGESLELRRTVLRYVEARLKGK